jgi:hypothetical protein
MSRNVVSASRFRRQTRPKNEGGYLLLELALVLAIATIMLSGQINQIITAVDEGNALSTAKYLQRLQGGINEYEQANEVAVKTAGATITGFANPLQPTIPELVTGGYIEAGFPVRSPLGITFQNTLARTGTSCPEGPDCRVSGFATATAPYKDGEGQLRIDILTSAVTYIGLDAGMSLPESPALLTSVGGATVANPAGAVAGILAIRIGHGSGLLPLLTQYYKLDGSRPLVGAMNANGHDINGVRDLEASRLVKSLNVAVTGDVQFQAGAVPGTTCTLDGSTRKNANGTGLVICSGGSWQLVGNVVAGIGDGQPCTEAGQLGSNTTGAGFVCNGSYWSTVNSTATAGDTCAPAGRMATAISNREQLVCSNGRFVRLANMLSRQVEVSRLLVTDGTTVNKPACESGGTASYSFQLTQTVVNVAVTPPRQAMYIAAADNGLSWVIKIKVKDNTGAEFTANDYSISAVMKLECAY